MYCSMPTFLEISPVLHGTGDEFQFLALRAVNVSSVEAQDAVATWFGSSLLMITTRLRPSVDSKMDGCAPVLSVEPMQGDELEMVEVQQLACVLWVF